MACTIHNSCDLVEQISRYVATCAKATWLTASAKLLLQTDTEILQTMGRCFVAVLGEGTRSPNGEIFALLVSRLARTSKDRCKTKLCTEENQAGAGEEGRVQLDFGIICKKKKNNVPNADPPRCKGDGGRNGYDVCGYLW